ncbi:MAG: CvpA family protein [candidate division Zixibacteria bacterium]|nr:CvpA family protein [candidate division Zixibacteria bacterium]
MNWIDGVLLVLLLVSVIIGSKKGLIRELMAFVVFFVAIIVSVNYIDNFAVWVYDKVGGSPLVAAFLSFAILLAATYAGFKILGLLFYKVAAIKTSGRRDQMGGALIGFLRGWAAIGFLTFLMFLLPMPERFYVDFEASLFGPTVAKTVPLMYEGTNAVHPQKTSFVGQIENAIIVAPMKTSEGNDMLTEDRAEIYRVMHQIDRFFNTGLDNSQI